MRLIRQISQSYQKEFQKTQIVHLKRINHERIIVQNYIVCVVHSEKKCVLFKLCVKYLQLLRLSLDFSYCCNEYVRNKVSTQFVQHTGGS